MLQDFIQTENVKFVAVFLLNKMLRINAEENIKELIYLEFLIFQISAALDLEPQQVGEKLKKRLGAIKNILRYVHIA